MRKEKRSIRVSARPSRPPLDERGSSLLPVVMVASLVSMAMFNSVLHFDSMMKQQSVNRAVASRQAIEQALTLQLRSPSVILNSAQLIASNLGSSWITSGGGVRNWVRRCLLNDAGVPSSSQGCFEPGGMHTGSWSSTQNGHLQGFPIASLIPGEPPLSGSWVDDGSPEGLILQPVYYRADGRRCITSEEVGSGLWASLTGPGVVVDNPASCALMVGTRLEGSCSGTPVSFAGSADCGTVSNGTPYPYEFLRVRYVIQQNPEVSGQGGGATTGMIAIGAIGARRHALPVLSFCQAMAGQYGCP